MTEYSHSFSKDLQWNNQSQLVEHDVPQFQGFAFVTNRGTCATQQAINVHLGLVVQMVDNAIQWINLYRVDSAIGFHNTYPIQRLNNRGLYNSFIKLQWKTSTKVKMLQHCLIHL